MAEKDEKPKIIVDDDWKSQAQAEKEKLAHEVDKPGAGGAAAGGEREIPPATLTTLVWNFMISKFVIFKE